VVAAQVGQLLGWRVINRAIPAEVAESLSLPLEVAEANDEHADSRFWGLMTRSAVLLASEAGGELPREAFNDESAYRTVTEVIVRRIADSSDSVIVGRAAAAILQGRADTLHVRLDGPVRARILQAMAALHLTEKDAVRMLKLTDESRRQYVKRFYGREWADQSHYHLTADNTALTLETCTQFGIDRS